jgi:hypothetical protein
LRRRRLYYTQLRIGSPAKGYYVQVDTGSDVLWVNCIRCDGCPTRSDLGVPFLLLLLPREYSFMTVQSLTHLCRRFSSLQIKLTQYDPAGSGTTVGCDQAFCVAHYGGVPITCSSTSSACPFEVTYGDGDSTAGFFVSDVLQYSQASADGQTSPANASITFG